MYAWRCKQELQPRYHGCLILWLNEQSAINVSECWSGNVMHVVRGRKEFHVLLWAIMIEVMEDCDYKSKN